MLRRLGPGSTRRVRVLHGAYDGVYFLLVAGLLPLFLYKLLTSRRARAGLRQRFGGVPSRPSHRPCLWIHGVSVGEVKAARPLVEALAVRLPDWELVLSTTTLQGYQVARQEHPDRFCFYYPLDFSWVTRRVLRRIRPRAVVLMELELWPNFLLTCDALGIPVCLVNGRISRRSYRGYRVARRFLPEPHQRIRFYAVQNEEYARRILQLGVRPEVVHVTGQMKYDNLETDPARVARLREEGRRLFGFDRAAWVLFGGSTHPPEERWLLAALRAVRAVRPEARLVLAPRHLERLQEVEEEVRRAGFRPHRRTAGPAPPGSPVVVLDTVGELARLYAAADLVFVGGSLVPHGGQSMIEPAGLQRPVLFGPHTWNFADSVRALKGAGAAVEVGDPEDLQGAVLRLARDGAGCLALGRRAWEVVVGLQGATDRNVALILTMLGERRRSAPRRLLERPGLAE